MAATPNLNELKDATESGKLVDAFKLLITHDKAEEQSFISRIGEESSHQRDVIKKQEQTLTEAATSYTRFNAVAATGQDCLMEIQMKDRRKLDLLAQLLLLSRQSMEEKDELLERIEQAEEGDEDQDLLVIFFCVLMYVLISFLFEWQSCGCKIFL